MAPRPTTEGPSTTILGVLLAAILVLSSLASYVLIENVGIHPVPVVALSAIFWLAVFYAIIRRLRR